MKNHPLELTMTAYFAGLMLSLTSSSVSAVTWEMQAERLQLVSAAMLDAEPMLAPIDSTWHVAVRSVVSVLPKTNATVGAKTEQPPQPPVHTVPTLEVGVARDFGIAGNSNLRLWGGYLPPQGAKMTEMTASCEQQIYGLSLGYSQEHLREVNVRLDVGVQASKAVVKGGITEVNTSDRFDVSSRIDFIALSFSPQRMKSLWVQGQVAQRRVATRFEIPSDSTVFDLVDESKIGSGASTQIAAGYEFMAGFTVAAGYLNVPERLSMPRFLLGYHLPTGGMSQSLMAKN